MKLVTSLFLSLLAALAAHAATEPEIIKAARLNQNEAIAQRRFDDAVTFWTDDVTICRGLGAQLAGKAAYRKLVEENAGAPTAIVYQRLPDAIEASSLWPLAFETGTWQGHVGNASGPVVISGRYSAQWVKRDGRWLIRAEVFVALDGAGAGREFKATP
jgi:ketosteroid isomerase-like protein